MYLANTIRTAVADHATRPMPAGPGFDPAMADKAETMEVYTPDARDRAPAYYDVFVLRDGNGAEIARQQVWRR